MIGQLMNSISRLDLEPTDKLIINSIKLNQANRNEDLSWFIRMLNRTRPPYTYMIDASWGDGKTFFLKSAELVLKVLNPNIDTSNIETNQIESFLDNLIDVNEPILPFYFNAWENDYAEEPLTALLANMAIEFNSLE